MCISVPMQIVGIEQQADSPPSARACFEGVVKEVSMAMLPDLQVGDYVLVQFGLATRRLEPDEARQTLELLRELNDLESEEGFP